MSECNEFKYSVIQFLEVPYKDVIDYVCVPTSWVHARGPYDRKVKVSYPLENPLDTERRVRQSKKKSDDWNTYLSVIKHSTDNYDDAKRYIQRMIPALQNADKTQSSVEENPRRSTRKNKNKSGNTTTLKWNALQDPDEEPHNKRSRVTDPDESDDVTLPASQAFEATSEDKSIPHTVSEKDQRQTESIDESKYRNTSENVQTVNQNPVEENHYLIPEKVAKNDLFGEFFRCVLRDLQTNLQVYTASLVTDAVTKIMNNSNTAWRYDYSIPSLMKTTPQGPILNEKKINEDHTKQKDTDAENDDEDQPLKKISKPKRMKNIVLPAEYDEDDSKWTLKYRKPALGLVELMKHSGVYVKALELANCKRLSKDCKSLARMLLSEIFNTDALGTCSWTGARAKAFDQDGTHVRPGLDENARTVLMNYVAEYAKKEGWCYENHTILNSIRNKMQEMRVKYKSKLSESKRISKQKKNF